MIFFIIGVIAITLVFIAIIGWFAAIALMAFGGFDEVNIPVGIICTIFIIVFSWLWWIWIGTNIHLHMTLT